VTLEKDLVDAIREALSAMGIVTWSGRVYARRGGRRNFVVALGPGTPDVLGVVNGRMFAIEAKRDEKSLERESQIEWMANARRAGVECGTARSVAEALAIVEKVRKHAA
jgi:hypothetical protein